MVDLDLRQLALSLTVAAAELDMSARVLDMEGYSSTAITLDELAQHIRQVRNVFCHDNKHEKR